MEETDQKMEVSEPAIAIGKSKAVNGHSDNLAQKDEAKDLNVQVNGDVTSNKDDSTEKEDNGVMEVDPVKEKEKEVTELDNVTKKISDSIDGDSDSPAKSESDLKGENDEQKILSENSSDNSVESVKSDDKPSENDTKESDKVASEDDRTKDKVEESEEKEPSEPIDLGDSPTADKVSVKNVEKKKLDTPKRVTRSATGVRKPSRNYAEVCDEVITEEEDDIEITKEVKKDSETVAKDDESDIEMIEESDPLAISDADVKKAKQVVKEDKKDSKVIVIDTNTLKTQVSITPSNATTKTNKAPNLDRNATVSVSAAAAAVVAAAQTSQSQTAAAVTQIQNAIQAITGGNPAIQGLQSAYLSAIQQVLLAQGGGQVSNPHYLAQLQQYYNTLGALQDDAYVIEAPSFIVPYVMEGKPTESIKDFLLRINKVEKPKESPSNSTSSSTSSKKLVNKDDKSSKKNEETEKVVEMESETTEKEKKDSETPEKDSETPEKDSKTPEKDSETAVKDSETAEKDSETAEKDIETAEKESEDSEKDSKKTTDKEEITNNEEKTEVKEDANKSDKSDVNGDDEEKTLLKDDDVEKEKSNESKELKDNKSEKEKEAEKNKESDETKETESSEDESKKEDKKDAESNDEECKEVEAKVGEEDKENKDKVEPVIDLDKEEEVVKKFDFGHLGRWESYYNSALGSFFLNLGLNQAQEFIQTDIVKMQKRKLEKMKNSPSKVEVNALKSLDRQLSITKKKNSHLHVPTKSCKFCNFKTESQLVMERHLESPHMVNYTYKCNFCDFETRGPQVILFHTEAEHNIRGRLERAPAFFQCALCPYEDNNKSKMTRHSFSCLKKFKADKNCDLHDWEPPAKIPKIQRGRPNSFNKTFESLKMPTILPKTLGLQNLQNAINSSLIGNSSLSSALSARGRGRPIGSYKNIPQALGGSRSNQSNMLYSNRTAAGLLQSFPGATSINLANQVLQSVQGSSSCNRVPRILPASSSNSLIPGLSASSSITIQSVQNKSGSNKSPQQPSISITPLPRGGTSPASGKSNSSNSRPTFVICEICDGYIKDLEQLRNHMNLIHKVKIHPKMIFNRPPLNCQKCQHRFFTDQGLERHLLGTHGLVTSSMQEAANKCKDAGRCPICGKVFQWKLLNHVSRDHKMVLKPAHLSYKCTVCTATFNMYRLFENHVYSAHSVVNKNKNNESNSSVAASSSKKSVEAPLKINDEITIIPQPATKGSKSELSSKPAAKKSESPAMSKEITITKVGVRSTRRNNPTSGGVEVISLDDSPNKRALEETPKKRGREASKKARLST